MSRNAVVIGAGVGGLSAAWQLARAGWNTTLIEATDRVGGKMGWYQWTDPASGTYVWDTGPSLITMPFVFRELFSLCGERIEDHLSLVPVEPLSRYLFADGARLDTCAGPDHLVQRARQAFGERAARQLAAFLDRGQRVWEEGGKEFLYDLPEQAIQRMMRGQYLQDPDRIRRLSLAESWKTLAALAPWSSYADVVLRDVQHPALRDILLQYATYSGTSPWKAPATLSSIAWIEHCYGGWYIRGGLHALATCLASLFQRDGGTLRLCTPASRIEFSPASTGSARSRTVHAVKLADGTRLPADVIVCNADAMSAHAHLIRPADRPSYPDTLLRQARPSGSGVVFLWAVNRCFPILQHHTKFIPDGYTADLRAMFHHQKLGAKPAIYINATCRTDPDHAPANGMNLFVLASAPALNAKIDWTDPAVLHGYRQRVLQSITARPEWGLDALEQHIVHEKIITPLDFQNRLNAWKGSIYGLSGGGIRQSRLRPHIIFPDARGLYFVGGATHPGGGLPLVVLSSRIACSAIQQQAEPSTPPQRSA